MARKEDPLRLAEWPVPLKLLTALLRSDTATAVQLAGSLSPDDWLGFRDLVIERHRVAPMIAAAVTSQGIAIPDCVMTGVRKAARQCGIGALAQRAECLRIDALLRVRGISPVWLKGWPLAAWLYGDVGLRHASDLDLLVSPGERVSAALCLADAGYVAEPNHRLRARLIARPVVGTECKDLELRHSETVLRAELHWRTNHFPHWPGTGALTEPPAITGSGASAIRVPGPVAQLIYLSAHGQQHLFGRLKWLLDIALLAEKRGSAQLARDLKTAERIGVGPPVRLALNLAGAVFGGAVPTKAAQLSAREADWAAALAGAIADPGMAPGSWRARIAFYRWHWRMAGGRAQRLGVLRDAVWRRVRLGAVGLATAGAFR